MAYKMQEHLNKVLGALTLEEQKQIVLAYKDYTIKFNFASEASFGRRFILMLEDAVDSNDRRNVLKMGVKDVLSTFIAAQGHAEGKRLEEFFSEKLGPETYKTFTRGLI